MDPRAWLDDLLHAVNAHDPPAVAACFAPDYVNEAPAHIGRGFVGRAQVLENWQRMFAGVPDLHATVLGSAVDDRVVWSEWEIVGTRRDGGRHLMRGVVIARVWDRMAVSARFYLEPVDAGEGGVRAAVGRAVGQDSQ